MSRVTGLERGVFVLGATCILCSCAVMSPEIHDSRLFDAKYGAQPAVTEGKNQHAAVSAKFAGDLPVAMDDANSQSNAYSSAASQYSELRNGSALGAGVTGIAAVLLSAMNHGSQNLRIGLGGASASLLGLGGYYDNRARQQVYLAGVTAITCSIEAVRPLLQTQEQYNKLAKDESDLRDALGTIQTDLHAGKGRGIGGKLNLDDATAAQDAAIAVLKTATAFDLAYDSAGVELRSKVREIVAAVDVQVVKTDPDPAAMSRVISGFSPTLPKVPAATAGVPKNVPVADAPPDWFDVDVITIKARTELLRQEIGARTQPADIDKSLSGCKVAEVAGKLKVSPAESSHVISKVPTTLVYVISSGTLPLTVGLTGEYPDGAFTYKQADSTVTVSVTKDALGQKSTLTIADSSGAAPVTVDISVNANATVTTQDVKAQKDKTNQANPPVVKPKTNALTAADVNMVRRVLGIAGESASSTLSKADLDKLKGFADTEKVSPDFATTGSVTPSTPVFTTVVAAARKTAESLPVNDAEKALINQNQVATLRGACKLPAAPSADKAFDAALRDKIFDFELGSQQSAFPLPAIDGRLDQTVLNAMLKAQCAVPSK